MSSRNVSYDVRFAISAASSAIGLVGCAVSPALRSCSSDSRAASGSRLHLVTWHISASSRLLKPGVSGRILRVFWARVTRHCARRLSSTVRSPSMQFSHELQSIVSQMCVSCATGSLGMVS
jgi:hypothetical protein